MNGFKVWLRSVLHDIIRQELEATEEKWLTADQLIAQFGCFTTDWLKRYGHLLPRTKVSVLKADEVVRETKWCYPMHKINRMLQDGSIRNLTL